MLDIAFTQDKCFISVASVNVGFITDTEIVFILGESMSQVCVGAPVDEN